MASVVFDITWTIDLWKRWGMSSKPGSVGFNGGRMRTAVIKDRVLASVLYLLTHGLQVAREECTPDTHQL